METQRKFELKNILFILGLIGPGIITAIADNDAGGIATYSVAGANFGLTMLWALIPIFLLPTRASRAAMRRCPSGG